MSQLPPPNFVNVPPPFNMYGFPALPTQGTSPSIFGRPPIPLSAFPPRLPVTYFPRSPVSQFRPPPWLNMNRTPNHVLTPRNHGSSPSHEPQVPNFQAKTSNKQGNNANSSFTKQPFSCDACQMEFASKEALNAHFGSHVECNDSECSFKASRKMLKLHWIQVHASGKMRIKLDTPEEIAKWREERKRKYPTVANVEKKKEEKAKRQASGQVLKTQNFRYRRGQRRDRTFQQGGLNHFNNRNRQRRGQEDFKDKSAKKFPTSEKAKQNGNEESTSQNTKKLQNGEDPLSFVLAECNGEESDTEIQTKEKLSPPRKLPTKMSETGLSNGASSQSSALLSLCSAYASDSDEYEEQREISHSDETSCVKHINRDDMEKPEVRKELETMPDVKRQVEHQKKRRPRKFQRRNKKAKSKVDSKSFGVRKSTLLEKLLAPEICHERNVILQCLRYIIKKNFFGVEQTDSALQNIDNS